MDVPAGRQGEVFDLPTRVQQVKSRVQPEPGVAPKIQGFVAGAEVGPYQIRGLVGFGGMGVIYRAYQPSLEREVAIKALSPDLVEQEGFVERFNREALSLARLNHPGIVAVIDKGVHNGQYYFVMEFVDGVSLRSMIRERPMEMKPALLIMSKVCEALEYAHSQGFVHRDIKPENILIDTRGIVKLADFGLAVLAEPAAREKRMTGGRVLVGTLDYMAPEQRENSSSVDARADIYALGVVLYETLTGRVPLGRFARPSECAAVDPRLDRIVMKMLDRDPDRRYRSAAEIGRELARISASGVTVLEKAESRDEMLKFAGRKFYTMSTFLRRMTPVLSFLEIFWAGVFVWLAVQEWLRQSNYRWTYICCALILVALSYFTLRISRNFFVAFAEECLALRPYFRIPWKSIERFYTQEKHPSFFASHVAVLVRYRMGGIQVIRTVIGNPAFLENSTEIVEGIIAYATHHGIPVDEELLSWRWRNEAEDETFEPAAAETGGFALLRRIPVVTGVCRNVAQFLNVDPYMLRIVLLLAVIVCGTIRWLRPIGYSLVFLYAAAALLLPRGEDRK